MMKLMVSAIRINGDDNLDIELRDPAGGDLPIFTPGAHIDIRTPGGAMRQYSLCGPIEDRRSYRICVRKDGNSRGGSRSLHGDLRVRAAVDVGEPRNLFSLPEARRYILVSAGIGITPIISMARRLAAGGADYQLHHVERSRSRVAFLDELTSGPLAIGTTLHLGDEGANFRTSGPSCLSKVDPEAVVLACGPNGFLDLLQARLVDAGWSAEQIHFERFRPEAPPAAPGDGDLASFEVQIASTGQNFVVGPDTTVADVLQLNGIPIELSCEQGMCGACLTGVLSGTPDHKDIVLSESERAANDQMTICCSRSSSPVLVLDL
jgi:vanillate monooxygenase ferredoxin subunit